MSEVRPTYAGEFYDTIILLMNGGGEVQNSVVISQGSLKINMNTAKNGLFWVDDAMYFAGWSQGFETEYQSLEKSVDKLDSDVYVYKYRFGEFKMCLRLFEPESSTVQRNLSYNTDPAFQVTSFGPSDSFMTKEDNYYSVYPSRYAGGFGLLDTIKIPRPCAYASMNLTSVEYYRG